MNACVDTYMLRVCVYMLPRGRKRTLQGLTRLEDCDHTTKGGLCFGSLADTSINYHSVDCC